MGSSAVSFLLKPGYVEAGLTLPLKIPNKIHETVQESLRPGNPNNGLRIRIVKLTVKPQSPKINRSRNNGLSRQILKSALNILILKQITIFHPHLHRQEEQMSIYKDSLIKIWWAGLD